MKIYFLTLIILLSPVPASLSYAQENVPLKEATPSSEITTLQELPQDGESEAAATIAERDLKPNHTIFDDRMLLDGYSDKYKDFSKEILLEMIKDETLAPFKSAAAVRVFREKFAEEVVSKEKKIVEKSLLRRLNRTTSPFIQVEIMYTLNTLDRYRYFKSMTPALIQKLNHYNQTVNEIAFEYLEDITKTSNYRAREARVIFNTLRKILFLSRRRLAQIEEPDARLARKLKLVRWSIKVLGNEQLKRLPKEVLGLL